MLLKLDNTNLIIKNESEAVQRRHFKGVLRQV